MENKPSGLKPILCLIALAGAFTGGVYVTATNAEYIPSVRIAAVEHKCGGYDHVNGAFRWETPTTADELMITAMPTPEKHLTPQRKPVQ